jgi:hypothetical protein
MKHLKTYKIFESKENLTKDYFVDKVNHELIQNLKDISLDLLDDINNLELVYTVNTSYHKVLYGFYRTSDENFPDNLSELELERELLLNRLYAENNLAQTKEHEHWMSYYDEHTENAIKEYKSDGLSYSFAFHKGKIRTESFEVLSEIEHDDTLIRIRSMYPNESINIIKF